MALEPGDLIAPEGELETTLFPDGSLLSRVTQWLAEAALKTTELEVEAENVDQAQRAWVYHRAYKAASIRILSSPESETIGATSRKMSVQQAAALQRLAELYLDEFNGLAPEDEGTLVVGPPGSFSVRNEAVW